jgi:hypothetical protein
MNQQKFQSLFNQVLFFEQINLNKDILEIRLDLIKFVFSALQIMAPPQNLWVIFGCKDG